MDTDLSRVAGADVFLLFIESYGAVSYERPALRRSGWRLLVETSRRQFARHRSRRRVGFRRVADLRRQLMARAHQRSCRAVEVRDRDTNALLMTAEARHAGDGLQATRVSDGGDDAGLVAELARRRVLRLRRDLWRLPARLRRAAVRLVGHSRSVHAGADGRARGEASHRAAPLFVFFPTISTHIPFSPTPPYQPDWPRALDRASVRRRGRGPCATSSSPTG